MGHDQPEANAIAAEAVENGAGYFDVAPSYGKGEAEARMGPALLPFRSDVFLACKTGRRDAERSRLELENSLRTLRTDHFDLYQLHGVQDMDQARRILAPGGAIETLARARDEGKTRYIGFSAHSEEAALFLLDSFPFDSVLFPLNFVCWHQGGFGPAIYKKALEKDIARLAIKSLAFTTRSGADAAKWPKCWYRPVDTPEMVEKAIRFTLSKDVTAAVSPSHVELFRMALDAARRFTPLSPAEETEIARLSQGVQPVFSSR
ncbi:MAG: aldo/keto reductase [Planctomycetes bacterium]|nr:aldo/keto reductase [Planctomycetota bacterium]